MEITDSQQHKTMRINIAKKRRKNIYSPIDLKQRNDILFNIEQRNHLPLYSKKYVSYV